MVVEELLVKLGFFSDLKGLKEFQSRLVGVKKNITDAFEKVEAVGIAISAFFAHHLEGIDQQAKFAKQVDISVEKLQELQYAANIAGSSNDDLNNSIRSLNKSIFEASEGVGGATEVFGRLGIATTVGGHLRPTLEIFKELADKIRTLPKPEQEEFAQHIGISQSTILLLNKGSQGIKELMNEAQQLGVYSEEDAKKAEAYADSWRALTQIFRILKDQIALGLAPVFTDIVKQFTEWLKLNKQLIIQDSTAFLKIVIGVLTILGKVLDWILTGFDKLIDALGGFEGVLDLLGSAAGLVVLFSLPKIISAIAAGFRAAAVAATIFDLAAFWPVALGIAAFALLLLVVQDIVVWFRHGESAIGHLLGPIDDFKKSVIDLYHTITGGIMTEFKAIHDFFHAFIEDIENRIKVISDFFSNIYEKTKHVLHIKTDSATGDSAISNQVPLTNGVQISNLTNNNNQTGDSKNNIATSNNYTINISGGNNSDIAEQVKQGIYQAARQAQRNNASPVKI
jgi:DNA-binding XRE family transcriptional regulator